jgi:hypothetical protein
MNSDQKKVAIGALIGVASMVALVALLYLLLPALRGMDDSVARLVFTLKMNAFAILPLFVGIAAVANGRFASAAIDPLRHAEIRAIEINGRFVDNTLQQNFVFLVGTLALSIFLDAQSIKLVAALTIVYILARIVFWIGYRIDPLYRAPGMAATSYLNLGILLSLFYFLIA